MRIQTIQNCFTFLCVYGVLQITTIQDIKDMDNVSWSMFLLLPLVRIAFLFLNPEMQSFWSPFTDSFAGSAIGILMLILSFVGICGGADIIMIACVGFTIGFVDTIHALLYASVLMLVFEGFKAIVTRSIKEISHKSVPYIPYFNAGFVVAFVINHFMEVY